MTVQNVGNRILAAAKRYLELKGYELVEEQAQDGLLVWRDEDDLVFVNVIYDHNKFPRTSREELRSWFEDAVVAYLKEQEEPIECNLRMDELAFNIIDENKSDIGKAILRHCVNVIGGGFDD